MTIKKGSLVSRYGQLYLAFAASAFLHHFPALMHGTGGEKVNQNQLVYFLIQPLAITAEDVVIYLGKKAGIKQSCESSNRSKLRPGSTPRKKATDVTIGKTRALGKIWTFSWFTCCLRLMFQPNIEALSKPIMPSLCKAVVRLAGRLGKTGSVNGAREL